MLRSSVSVTFAIQYIVDKHDWTSMDLLVVKLSSNRAKQRLPRAVRVLNHRVSVYKSDKLFIGFTF